MSHDRTTRRGFFKQGAGLAAAGMAAPYFFSTLAVAEESKEERLIVAAIGVGGRGSDIGRQAALLGNMVACADVNLDNAEKFAAKYGGGKCQVYQDYRKVLERKDIAAVTIGTPDHWHVKIAIEAMQAGKDVYCEKPLTLTIDEGRLVCEATKATGRVFQVGTQQRSEYKRGFLEAVAIARSGRLGGKLKARASVGEGAVGGPFPTAEPPKTLDWDFWLGQAPSAAFTPQRCFYTFRYWLDYSGGQITDWGVHHTDIALWALGGELTGVAEVEGKGDFPLGRELTRDYMLGKKSLTDLPNAYNTAKSYACDLILPNGNAIRLDSGDNDVYIEGEQGHLAVNRNGIRGKFVEKLKADPEGKKWLDEEVAKLYRGKPLNGHMANFFACVKDRTMPISDVWSHCNTMNACHMANIAMLLERKIVWDAEKRQFVGDDEANQLISRKQRQPYGIEA